MTAAVEQWTVTEAYLERIVEARMVAVERCDRVFAIGTGLCTCPHCEWRRRAMTAPGVELEVVVGGAA